MSGGVELPYDCILEARTPMNYKCLIMNSFCTLCSLYFLVASTLDVLIYSAFFLDFGSQILTKKCSHKRHSSGYLIFQLHLCSWSRSLFYCLSEIQIVHDSLSFSLPELEQRSGTDTNRSFASPCEKSLLTVRTNHTISQHTASSSIRRTCRITRFDYIVTRTTKYRKPL
jgi:hypothetical protein